MECRGLLQTLADRAMGDLRTVAIAAEVTEVDVAQVGGNQLLRDEGGGVIGQMPVAAQDPLFDAPGATGVLLQEFEIVVRFEEQNICGAHPLKNQPGGVPEIGEKADVTRWSVDEKPDRIIRVMRDAERVDDHIAQLERGTGGEEAKIELGLELQFNRLFREPVAIDWNLQLGGQPEQPLDVVRVFVRDENAVEIFRRAADREQALADLAPAQPGIDEQPDLFGFQVGAVAARTAAENR